MLRIGLTGGIGTGKTTVSDKFNTLYNIPVIDADQISRSLLAPNGNAYQEAIALFGKDIVLKTGEINRKLLRSTIFSNHQARTNLENILHPKIRSEISKQINALDNHYCLIVIPLLIESNLQSMVDKILVVDASEKNQISRVVARDQSDPEQIKSILRAQASSQERLNQADDVITNNGSFADLEEQIKDLHQKYLAFKQ